MCTNINTIYYFYVNYLIFNYNIIRDKLISQMKWTYKPSIKVNNFDYSGTVEVLSYPMKLLCYQHQLLGKTQYKIIYIN